MESRLSSSFAHRELRLDRLTQRTVRLFYFLSPPVFGAIAWLVLRFRGIGFAQSFRAPVPATGQILAGTLIGVGAGLAVGSVIVYWSRLSSLWRIIREVFGIARPTMLDLILTSVSAGFAEELLFRGALQPLLGIWITSLVFALAHGAFTKATRGNLFLGLFIFSASLLLGAVYLEVGLMASMATHFALDMTALLQYRYQIAAVPQESIL